MNWLRIILFYIDNLFSDITIHVDGHQLRGHRFVLAARTEFWGDLSMEERIDFGGKVLDFKYKFKFF